MNTGRVTDWVSVLIRVYLTVPVATLKLFLRQLAFDNASQFVGSSPLSDRVLRVNGRQFGH